MTNVELDLKPCTRNVEKQYQILTPVFQRNRYCRSGHMLCQCETFTKEKELFYNVDGW